MKLLVAAALAVLAAAAIPPRPAGPAQAAALVRSGQVIVVSGVSQTSTAATVRAYQRLPDGRWSQQFSAMPARIGYGGWAPAASRVQDTGTTPAGVFGLTTAFGLGADPGARLPYTRADADDYWVGDEQDPRTYNMFQPSASAARTWRTARAERLAAYPVQYEHAVVIDFNRPRAPDTSWDSAHSQWVTTTPVDVRRGSAIFLHVNGTGSTAGCVSVARADLIRLLTWLDPAKNPRIVMGVGATI